jgi:hypothetical protein
MTTLARTRSWLGLSLAIGVFVACLLVSLAFGPASLSLHDLVHYVITGPVHGDPGNTIFWQIRMPRVLLAFIVGASLSVAGVILQDLFLNPLTDPYVTGVSSGAALGATIGIVLHLVRLPWMTVLALVGGLRDAGDRLDGGAPARPDRRLRAAAGRRDHLVPGQRHDHGAHDPRRPGHGRHRLLAAGQLLRAQLAGGQDRRCSRCRS